MKPSKNRSSEHQNYLTARNHKPSMVIKQVSPVNQTRYEARQKQAKQNNVSDLKFITT